MLALSSMYFLNMKYEMCISRTTAVRIHINHQCPLQHRREALVCCCLLESSTKWCARYFQYFLVRLGSRGELFGRKFMSFEVIVLNMMKNHQEPLYEPSRNCEFCQPEYLKCLLDACAYFCGGILNFWP